MLLTDFAVISLFLLVQLASELYMYFQFYSSCLLLYISCYPNKLIIYTMRDLVNNTFVLPQW